MKRTIWHVKGNGRARARDGFAYANEEKSVDVHLLAIDVVDAVAVALRYADTVWRIPSDRLHISSVVRTGSVWDEALA